MDTRSAQKRAFMLTLYRRFERHGWSRSAADPLLGKGTVAGAVSHVTLKLEPRGALLSSFSRTSIIRHVRTSMCEQIRLHQHNMKLQQL